MEQNKSNNYPKIRYWTFEEWQEAGEIHRYDDCSIGIVQYDSVAGKRVRTKMTNEELSKLQNYLEAAYFKEVTDYFEGKKGQFAYIWDQFPDHMLISREIDKVEFHLHPEKFVDKPEPYAIKILHSSYKRDIPHIRRAYADILTYGRDTLQLDRERDENYCCVVEGMKLYLDWLISFQLYLETHELNNKTLLNFIEKDAVFSALEVREERNPYEQHIRKELSELEKFFTRTGEYEKAVGWLVSFFKNEPIKIDKPVFISGNTKSKLQLRLGNIYNKCASGKYSDEYLETLSKVFEVLHADNFDPKSSHAKKLRKRLSG